VPIEEVPREHASFLRFSIDISTIPIDLSLVVKTLSRVMIIDMENNLTGGGSKVVSTQFQSMSHGRDVGGDLSRSPLVSKHGGSKYKIRRKSFFLRFPCLLEKMKGILVSSHWLTFHGSPAPRRPRHTLKLPRWVKISLVGKTRVLIGPPLSLFISGCLRSVQWYTNDANDQIKR
jgi:hypothetical protein